MKVLRKAGMYQMQNRLSYMEIIDLSKLEEAAKILHLEETEETEIGLLNLHNHLVWHSYIPGNDPEADAIILCVVRNLLDKYNMDLSAVPTDFKCLFSE